jgi:hypothetical protein
MKLLQDRAAVISGAATKRVSDWPLRSFLRTWGFRSVLDLERQDLQRVAATTETSIVLRVTSLRKINARRGATDNQRFWRRGHFDQ